MMSAIGRNASKVLRASARSGQVQEAAKVAPTLQGIRKYECQDQLLLEIGLWLLSHRQSSFS